DLEFPPYTGFAPRTGIPDGNIEALEGTLVTVRAHTNQPAVSGNLIFTKDNQARMSVESNDEHLLTGQFRVSESGTDTIHFKTTGGQLNPAPVVYDITAHKANAPTAKFLRPEPTTKAPSNAKVGIQMEATDDFGVKEMTLHVRQANEILRPATNYL